MAIEWRDNLSTGIEEIDLQHKELFSRINSLLEACNKGQGKEVVLGTLLFLDDYIKTHFAEEENLQKRLNYPGYLAHRDQHIRFVRQVDELERQFKSDGATIGLVLQTNRTMTEWLIEHISKVDKEFGEFIKGRATFSAA
jgi:hemerythrin